MFGGAAEIIMRVRRVDCEMEKDNFSINPTDFPTFYSVAHPGNWLATTKSGGAPFAFPTITGMLKPLRRRAEPETSNTYHPKTDMRFFVLGHCLKPQVREVAAQLRPVLERHGEIVVFDLQQEVDLTQHTADLAIVLGGDGSILRAARQMAYRQVPVLGVNLGTLGFLADLTPEELVAALPGLKAGDYRIATHLMFECEYPGPDGRQVVLGLNEVVLHALSAGHLTDLDLLVDGEPVTTFRGDGLIISTPVGSTAHSLSAGGPILSQELPAFVITPICPHTLTYRPVVDSASRQYTIRVRRPEGASLSADGQLLAPVPGGGLVTVRRAAVSFLLVKVAGRTYYQTLRDKLHWGTPPNYRTEPPTG